jgi:phosphoribosylaminoimidazolecarboxamide formyltransferase/IMP cyclohydrolase
MGSAAIRVAHCAHVKSNAVIFTDAARTLAVGAGQMSRVDAVQVAVMKALKPEGASALAGSVAASDAFFPVSRRARRHREGGATAIVQPGGSMRDGEVIAAADEHGPGDGVHRPAAFPALADLAPTLG